MWDWLLTPIDPARLHDVGGLVAWHGRLMVLAWSVLFPLGVISARFFKILPGQDWPRQIDNRRWWYAHLSLQYTGGVAMLLALILIWQAGGPGTWSGAHGWLGYSVLTLGALQFLGGWFRGSKGGPTQPEMRGDHYDMTPRRILFERAHKSLGYVALLAGVTATATGLWTANAPNWMWLAIAGWWTLLAAVFVTLQRAGRAFDTYQAIWGPDPVHPGNSRKPIGCAVRRRP